MKVGIGIIVDVIIIGVFSLIKNVDKQCDLEMYQICKGQQWYFGMKMYIGVDSCIGLVYSVVVMVVNVYDKYLLFELLYGNEQCVYGDSVYVSQRVLIELKVFQVKDFINQCVCRDGEIDEVECLKNYNKFKVCV